MRQEQNKHRRERDLRRYAHTTQARLILGGVLILLIVGNGLIRWVYGAGALRMSLLCTFAGLAPVVLIVIWLWLMERIVERNRRG
ncbi:MAG: hypothetical protein P8Z42_04635 [Anaerolineales bacterium]|jgi:hypothetical protein